MKKGSRQLYRDFITVQGKKTAIVQMKKTLQNAKFAQPTANSSVYSNDNVYLFYHQDFKPGADVSRIIEKKGNKIPARKEFVPPALVCDAAVAPAPRRPVASVARRPAALAATATHFTT